MNIAPSGSGLITKSPDKVSYIYGEQVTLTATANSGYTFDKWTGDVSGTINPITLTINRNKTVTGHFAQIPETVSTPTTPSGPSSGTIGAPYSYTTGGSTSSYDHPVEYQFDWKGNGTDLAPWGAATQSKIWTAAGTYKVKARARCTLDTSVISGWSGSIKVVIALNRSTRTLPLYYTPSLPLTVAITINPGQTTQAYSAEDSPPNGWTVSNINENGQWDDVNKRVKWGPFFDSNSRTLTYKVTPPSDETGIKTFSGTASFDGTDVAITGDSTFGGCSTAPITLQSPSDKTSFDACSLYPPPTFSWTAGETFRSYEIQFSPDESFSSTPVNVRVSGTTTQMTMTSGAWKRVLLIPGGTEGSVYWRIVGTRANRKTATSEVCSIIIEATQPVEGQTISPTSITSLPTLSWGNNCNTKFKVWFGNDPDFTKPDMKKKALSFNIKNPNDNNGLFTRPLTPGQWMAVRKLVGDMSGSTVYWKVGSWDGMNRHAETDVMSFVLTE